MTKKWTFKDLPSFEGRTVVVTGANSGLGLSTARALARVGARVVLAVRNVAKGEQAARSISGTTEVRPLDLADLDSVRRFADQWRGDVDVLILNAGIMAPPKGTTKDGFETQFGTNHLGHFALTNLLLPHVRDRVVVVASGAHRWGTIDFSDLNWERRPYERWAAYGQSKLANLLFQLELQRRLEETKSPLRAIAAHPGYAATELQSHSGHALLDKVMALGNVTLAQSADAGALPTLYAAAVDVPGGSYIGPDGPFELRGSPTFAKRTRKSRDTDVARRLWKASEELTGVSFPS